jgi:hypothetical protein
VDFKRERGEKEGELFNVSDVTPTQSESERGKC